MPWRCRSTPCSLKLNAWRLKRFGSAEHVGMWRPSVLVPSFHPKRSLGVSSLAGEKCAKPTKNYTVCKFTTETLIISEGPGAPPGWISEAEGGVSGLARVSRNQAQLCSCQARLREEQRRVEAGLLRARGPCAISCDFAVIGVQN